VAPMDQVSRVVTLATLCIEVAGPKPWLDELSRRWGPRFVWSERPPQSSCIPVVLLVAMGSDAAPKTARELYRRGDLMVTSIDGGSERFIAYVNGSFGSIEASIQVVLQRLLRERRGLLVHASAGVYQGEAWLIPGPSGAGKSTAARGGFDLVLSDELVALTLDPEPTLWGTPFWSEGRDEGRFPLTSERAPLNAITFPVKGARPALTPLSAVEGARRLTRCVTSYEGAEESGALFLIACELTERTPAFSLTFPKGGAWRAEL